MRHWQQFVLDRLDVGWLIAAVAAVVFACGLWWRDSVLLGGGAAVFCLLLMRAGSNLRTSGAAAAARRWPVADWPPFDASSPHDQRPAPPEETTAPPPRPPMASRPASPQSTGALVEELLATGRYALLLRPETKRHLTNLHVVRAIHKLDEAMALVPGGRVLLGQLAEQSGSAFASADVDSRLAARNLVSVEPVYLDRFCVTNEEYQRFVDAGGYDQAEFWHEEALPALLDFVDQTGTPAPRWWSDGQFPAGLGPMPVVGISWYEASAYARWVGKRLPSDAEWTKAGAWPVESSPGRIAQRRFPWGESFDLRRAALYGSGRGAPVAVDDYPGGVSVGGIHQLIGNVWEWTATPLVELGDPTLHVSESVMSIRGGAFDTYFENQATCHYQSGEQPLARRANIGFRLALPMSDLEAAREDVSPEGDVEDSVTDAPATEDAVVTADIQ